jgi:hypothetical protein
VITSPRAHETTLPWGTPDALSASGRLGWGTPRGTHIDGLTGETVLGADAGPTAHRDHAKHAAQPSRPTSARTHTSTAADVAHAQQGGGASKPPTPRASTPRGRPTTPRARPMTARAVNPIA